MRLNVQSDFALRLLMYLAVNPDSLCTIAEIAKHYGISKNHLMKVALALSHDGIVESVRGRAGGLRLNQAPDKISIGVVVRGMEGDFAIVECFQEKGGKCLITPACRLKGVMGEAVKAFLAVLDRYTIADLVDENPALSDLLKREAA